MAGVMGDWDRMRDDWELKVVHPSSILPAVVEAEVNEALAGGWEPFGVHPATGDVLLRRRQ